MAVPMVAAMAPSPFHQELLLCNTQACTEMLRQQLLAQLLMLLVLLLFLDDVADALSQFHDAARTVL